jgi:hypothetical protein
MKRGAAAWMAYVLLASLCNPALRAQDDLLEIQTDEREQMERDIFGSTASVSAGPVLRLPVGELLRYAVRWEFVEAGTAELECSTQTVDRRPVYRLTAQSRSAPSLDRVYFVRNRTDSYVDVQGFYTLKFTKEQNENGRLSSEYVLYDHPGNRWWSLTTMTTGYLPAGTMDVVAALYFIRCVPLRVGARLSIGVHTGDRVYPLIVDVMRRETVEVKGILYDCFLVEPKVDLKRFPLFRARGRLLVWLTVDEQRVPVRLQSRLFIGSVYADLVERVTQLR